MTLLNWILITVFAVLIVALFIIVVIVKRKAKDYEGICGINHGNPPSLRAPRRTVIVLMHSADMLKIQDNNEPCGSFCVFPHIPARKRCG